MLIPTHSHHRAVRFKPNGMKITRRNRHNIAPAAYIALADTDYYPQLVTVPSDLRPTVCQSPAATASNITPATYIAFAFIISTHSHHRAIRFKPDGTTPTRRNRHNIAPVVYIALVMLIPTHSHHSTVRFKTDCMSITRVRRHMNITSRDRHNIAPAAYITLAIFIITHSRHRSVRFKTNGMTTTRRYGIFGKWPLQFFHIPFSNAVLFNSLACSN